MKNNTSNYTDSEKVKIIDMFLRKHREFKFLTSYYVAKVNIEDESQFFDVGDKICYCGCNFYLNRFYFTRIDTAQFEDYFIDLYDMNQFLTDVTPTSSAWENYLDTLPSTLRY